MTTRHVLERRSTHVAYVGGVVVLWLVALVAGNGDLYPVSSLLEVARVLCLGPIGIAVHLGVLLPASFLVAVGDPGAPIGQALTLLVDVAVALANVRIVTSWRVRRRTAVLVASVPVDAVAVDAVAGRAPTSGGALWAPPTGAPLPAGQTPIDWTDVREPAWKGVVAALLFSFAGIAFILLCIVAGFVAATAHGIDYAEPESYARRALILSGVAWWAGLASAIAGLVLWIVRGRRGLSLLPFAIADLAVQVAGIILAIAATTGA